ncbi:hypothetical protein MLD38_000963 [Melastoma candidum]|uniref:Uncharacterized protein n=1 Tax=Melastoma candidum TaxID=119954 RepID=A0ACB9SGN0_9MYRT|nr:hypothetical protein MLD38_000963 [Melastoma candidum]
MASWLPRSIANSLRLDDEPLGQQDQYEDDGPRPDFDGDDRSEAAVPDHSSTSDRDGEDTLESSEEAYARGVKDDLEELKQSLTRQLWGVANLIAPPPSARSLLGTRWIGRGGRRRRRRMERRTMRRSWRW